MDSPTSAILAMHARFEASSAECDLIDATSHPSRCGDASKREQMQSAINGSIQEQDALRHAILLQVPDGFSDAAVLAFHIMLSRDCEDTATDSEKAALTVAIDTLFDFVASEFPKTAPLGASFARGAELVRNRRRLRTGEVEAE